TDAYGVAAQVPAACAAVAAVAARDVTFTRDAVTDLQALDLAADLDDHAAVFVADRHRHRDRLLSPRVPAVDVHVGAADRGLMDLDPHVVCADAWLGDVLHPDPWRPFGLDQCLHPLISLPGAAPRARGRLR